MIARRPSDCATYDCPLCGNPVAVPGQRCSDCVAEALSIRADKPKKEPPAEPLTPRVRKCLGCDAMITAQARRCKSCAKVYRSHHNVNTVRDYKAIWQSTKAKRETQVIESDERVDALIQIVSQRTEIAVDQIKATCHLKSDAMVNARRLVVSALRCGGYSYPRIARQLGYRDHTAARSADLSASESDKAESAELWRKACKTAETASA